jgi:hypothetical protein
MKDAKTSQERHDAIERLLRQSPGPETRPAPSESCLEAETLAAWVDGGLRGAELAAVESHAATCARCQATAATLVRHSPAAPEAERRSRAWLGWLVPLTAGAAAVALWFSIPDTREPRTSPPAEIDRQAADLRAPETPLAQDQDARGKVQSKLERDQPEGALRQEAPTVAGPDEREDRLRRTQAGEEAAVLDGLGQASTVRSASDPGAAAESAAAAAPAAFAKRASAAGTGSEVVSPDPRQRWRLGAAGTIEYSSDSGATWDASFTGVTADLTAGVSPLPSVCWVVGRDGTVLLTTDGRTWQRVPFPETIDLLAIDAADARTATLTATDGRTFRTTDAGATWR